jgi:hypothetical protein
MKFLEFQKKRYDKRFIKMVSFSGVIFNGQRVVSVEITADVTIIKEKGNRNYFNHHVIEKDEIFSYNHEGADTTSEIIFHPPTPSITFDVPQSRSNQQICGTREDAVKSFKVRKPLFHKVL